MIGLFILFGIICVALGVALTYLWILGAIGFNDE